MIYYIFLTILIIISTSVANHTKLPFKTKFQWYRVDYVFNSDEERNASIRNGTFNIGNIQPIDAQYFYNKKQNDEKVFITIPKFSPTGVPATLGLVSKQVRDGNPLLKPYPSWSWHINSEKCHYHRLVSVFRVWVDECKRLWVLDTGVVENDPLCPPQILVFDAETDQLLIKYDIPFNVHRNKTVYVTPVVEVEQFNGRPLCHNSWLYGADVNGSLLVFNLRRNVSWSYRDKSFDSNPNYTRFSVAGQSFEFTDGVLGLALSPPGHYKSRRLYYHPLADVTESWVNTRDLKKPVNNPGIFNTLPTKRDTQSAAEAFDKKGNLYFSLLTSIEIVSWNYRDPYARNYWKVIGDDQKSMQFPSGLKVSPGPNGQEQLWVFATSIQRFATGTLNSSEINFRLLYASLQSI